MDIKQLLEEEFVALDLNKDGSLEKREIEICLQRFGFKKESAKKFLDLYDEDHDGKISKAEFVKATQKKVPQREISCAVLRKMFHKIDKDKSGKLSGQELKTFLKSQYSLVFPTVVDDWIDQADADGDKSLSYEEFLNFVQNIL